MGLVVDFCPLGWTDMDINMGLVVDFCPLGRTDMDITMGLVFALVLALQAPSYQVALAFASAFLLVLNVISRDMHQADERVCAKERNVEREREQEREG
jgi:hypothetical protein